MGCIRVFEKNPGLSQLMNNYCGSCMINVPQVNPQVVKYKQKEKNTEKGTKHIETKNTDLRKGSHQ